MLRMMSKRLTWTLKGFPIESGMPICPSIKWRRSVGHRALAANLSSVLLSHRNPLSLIGSKLRLLPVPFPSALLRHILALTRSNPGICLRFFRFASINLSFTPSLLDLSTVFSILAVAGHVLPAAHLISPALRSCPAPVVLDCLARSASSCSISRSEVLSFALQLYSKLPSQNSMETFKKIKELRLVPSSQSLNALLNLLYLNGDIRTAWLVCAAALRLGSEMDGGSWAVMVRLLCREGKARRAEMLLDSGFSCCPSSYDLVVDCYARQRDVRAAIRVLSQMEERGLSLRLSTYASILEESCAVGNVKISGVFIKEMIVRGLLPMAPSFDFDWIIRKFCELGRTFSATLIFGKALSGNFNLETDSFACLLMALSRNGRQKEAVKVFDIMLQRGIAVDPGTLDVFVCGICAGEPMEKIDAVIREVMKNGFFPNASGLSTYIAENCIRGRWNEATELLDLAMKKCIVVDASCCCLLIKHLCNNGHLNLAISMHERMKELGGCLNVDSYNALLEALVQEGRALEADGVFDYMREKNVLSSLSFVIMITALCHEKELRKAMNLHDHMLKLALKPDNATYKKLITGFQ